MSKRRLLVTSALPYANGHIHLGHLVEYIQTDIWVRFQRARGNDVRFFCADDTHGTAIMMRARQERRSEGELIAEMSAAHQRDFAAFGVEFDQYGSTNSDSNREMCGEVWRALREAGMVSERDVSQLFDEQEGVFLADRFVTGTCPKCGATGQYGDSCDKCGATYAATDLVEPVSTLSGTRPVERTARHLFVAVEQSHAFLQEWTQSGALQPGVANYLAGHFLSEPLRDWDVSRPAPYFGFEIPDAPGNYWYVWFDAPVGYIAATLDYCRKTGDSLERWWRSPEVEIHHFIGKDITYFHTLFWPAMLKAAGFNLPRRVQVHGFLTVDGEKMSKSKGTFVTASAYLQHLDPMCLRYYYATKLTPRVDDLDLGLDDFVNRVNAELVNKIVNLASRTARFVEKAGLASTYPDDGGLFAAGAAAGESIAEAYEACDTARAMRLIVSLADRANEYVDRMEPWKLAKDPERAVDVQAVCTVALNLYRQIVIYLGPVVPALARATAELLGVELTRWDEAGAPVVGRPVAPFKHLMARVDPKKVQAVIAAGVSAQSDGAGSSAPGLGEATAPVTHPADSGDALAAEPLAEPCTFDDFMKVDLRVARVLVAEPVKDANKLLRLELGLGGEERRSVFAGIKEAYDPAALVGRLVVVVANLAPRKMKFGVSEGMVIAAGPGKQEVFLLAPDSGAKPGQRVH